MHNIFHFYTKEKNLFYFFSFFFLMCKTVNQYDSLYFFVTIFNNKKKKHIYLILFFDPSLVCCFLYSVHFTVRFFDSFHLSLFFLENLLLIFTHFIYLVFLAHSIVFFLSFFWVYCMYINIYLKNVSIDSIPSYMKKCHMDLI